MKQFLAASASALGIHTTPYSRPRNVRVYKKNSIGLASRYSDDREACLSYAAVRRAWRNELQLRNWTGVRHDTPHVPSSVVKLGPQSHNRY